MHLLTLNLTIDIAIRFHRYYFSSVQLEQESARLAERRAGLSLACQVHAVTYAPSRCPRNREAAPNGIGSGIGRTGRINKRVVRRRGRIPAMGQVTPKLNQG
jgi:hypothetical protein